MSFERRHEWLDEWMRWQTVGHRPTDRISIATCVRYAYKGKTTHKNNINDLFRQLLSEVVNEQMNIKTSLSTQTLHVYSSSKSTCYIHATYRSDSPRNLCLDLLTA